MAPSHKAPSETGSSSSFKKPDFVFSDRWLNAENGNMEKARKRFEATKLWREENNVNGLETQPQKYVEFLKKCYFHCWLGRDKRGQLIYYERPSKAGGSYYNHMIKSGLSNEAFLRLYLYMAEYQQTFLMKEMDQTLTIFDLKGITLSEIRGQPFTHYNSTRHNIYIRDVFCAPHLGCWGSQPKHVSNPAYW